jgi:protoporphyrinogen IX oxidase
MIATWIFGLAMAWTGDLWMQGWLHAKLALLAGMMVVHGALARWRKDFAADRNRHSQRFYRFVNEVPTLLMIGIVLLAVLKPF